MSKMLHENLRDLRLEDDNGDLVSLLDHSGKVTFWYELIRPDRAFKTAVQSALDQIKDATGFLLLHGAP